MPRSACLFAPLLTIALQGCIASAAMDIVTAPVKIAGRAADLATTSQSESDENRGREIRRREEQLGRMDREWRKQDADCRDGSRSACRDRDALRADMDALMGTLPYEPNRH